MKTGIFDFTFDFFSKGQMQTMTKATGVGRGGKRPGSGRRKRKTAGPIAVPPPSGLTAQQLAAGDVDLAIAVLVDVCLNGKSEIHRVRAAKLLLRIADSKSIRSSGRPS
jgi:hypothetical protein